MTRRLAVLLALLLGGAPVAVAQPAPAPAAPVAAPSSPVHTVVDPVETTAPLEKGDKAPFDGVLLTEAVMAHYLECNTARVKAEGDVMARDSAIELLKNDLAEANQRKINSSWWERNDFWIGGALGVTAALVMVVALR